MTTQNNPQGSTVSPKLSDSPIADPSVQQQLSLLFGATIFGPWPQLAHTSGHAIPRRRRKFAFTKWLVVFALMAAGFIVMRAAKHGMAQRYETQRNHFADELKVFLEDGNLPRVAQYAPLVEGATDETRSTALGANQPYLDLLVSAEAALYRYFDASPARLQKIQPSLANEGRGSPTREFAYLVTLSREERAARLTTIERLGRELPKAGGIEYLRASALEFSSDIESSRRAWHRSAALEPAWLGHRFEHAWFELRQHESGKARRLVEQMAQVDTEPGWSALAADVFGLPVTANNGGTRSAATTPVQKHFELLLHSIAAARSNRLVLAKDLLEKSSASVNYQAPFLFDAFDWCLAEQQPALARALSELPAWPRNTQISAGKLQRLSQLP